MKTAMAEEQVREAFRLYESGKTQTEIAKKYFISTTTLQTAFKRYGLQKPSRVRPVKNLTTGERFKSATAAAKAYRLDDANIHLVCKGERKTCGGYAWAYDEEVIP